MADSILEQENLFNQLKKQCSICKEFKTIDNFGKRSDVKSGLHSQCNACRAKFRKDHRSEIWAYEKQYRQTHKKDYEEWRLVYARQYRQAHKKEIALQKKQYFATKRGRSLKRKANIKYHARKYSTECEDFSPEEIFERDGYVCQLCGKKTRPDFKNHSHPLYPNLDHIVPLSMGGMHTRLNTQCLCFKCNTIKHNGKAGDQLRIFG